MQNMHIPTCYQIYIILCRFQATHITTTQGIDKYLIN